MKIIILHNDEGSVMLETILVLPVYLIFITVIFFAGEMSLYRNLLLQMDQHDLWAEGAREVTAGDRETIIEAFFPTTGERNFMGDFESPAQEKDPKVLSSNGWWQKNALKNDAVLKVPGWIRSVRVLVSSHPVNYKDEFKLRENDEKLVLFSRNDKNQWRNNCHAGEKLCSSSGGEPAWVTIINENYPGKNNEPAKITAGGISAYERQVPAYGIFTGEQ